MNDSRKKLSDDQYLLIDEMSRLEYDIRLRIDGCKRQSGHDVHFNTRALEAAEIAFTEAFMWVKRGIANEKV